MYESTQDDFIIDRRSNTDTQAKGQTADMKAGNIQEDKLTDRHAGRSKDGQTERGKYTCRGTNRQAYGQADRQTGRKTTDRQTNRKTHRQATRGTDHRQWDKQSDLQAGRHSKGLQDKHVGRQWDNL